MNYLQRKKMAFMSVVNAVKGFVRTVSGMLPLILNSCVSSDIINYQIYGDSVQNGTPTPDAPVEVESVGDKSANLCSGYFMGYPSASGMAKYKFPVKANTIYSINFNSNKTSAYKTIWLYDAEGNVRKKIIDYAYQSYSYDKVVVKPKEDGYMSLGFLIKADVMVVEGLVYTLTNAQNSSLENSEISTRAQGELEYEPYGYKIPVTASGKNLFNYKDLVKNGKTFEIDDGIQFEITGSRIETEGIPFIIRANTQYVLSAECTCDAYLGGKIHYNGTSYRWCDKTTKAVLVNNTTDTDISVSIQAIDTTGNQGSTIKFAMLEVDDIMSTNLDYEPYHEPVTTNIYLDEPLRKLKTNNVTYADYIDLKNSKVVRKVNYEKLGSKSWAMYSDVQPDTLGFYYSDGSIVRTMYPFCNILTKSKGDLGASGKLQFNYECFYVGVGIVKVAIAKSRGISDAETFKEFLNNKNAYMIYLLNTPIEKPIELPAIPTITGTNIIDVDTIIKPSHAEITYYSTSKE